jgi:hypothetical protein
MGMSHAFAVVFGFVLMSGCVAVKPYQRENLAAPAMESPFADDRAGGEYKDKVTQTRTGGGLPGGAPGGGCGCTQ